MFDSGKQILLVEPDPDLRSAIEELLDVFGYTVVAVANLDQALASCEQSHSPIDAIVVSAFMPRATGLEVIDAISQAGHRVPGLLFSVFAANDEMTQRMSAADIDYLPLPFSPDSFKQKLQQLLVHSHSDSEHPEQSSM